MIELPPVTMLADLRDEYARDARSGVPPHITVLFPFIAVDAITPLVRAQLSAAVRASPVFHYRLTETRWFSDNVLWLAPTDPVPFLLLTRAITEAFPTCLPYKGAYDGVIPHATVGDSRSLAELRGAEERISTVLPICGEVARVTLLAEGVDGAWRSDGSFPLEPPLA
ncbi:2'-5' RNA ligase family protein [Microbacterium sp. VKM Ac-2870]|uniref:2'-5' RNA ligase family protein n=1 Tax=Microbacterium sp. VKM Ac-2870 TaxID=2783825 RepID=UPI00188AC449|nr:2'-5' RNA ligase family protein [Microbacterium sp. VKM Ac-2870]MBF4560979.1 2'-5' RNA ligase family protein [Microbacterium sp. VKM Ac-2870]